MNRPQSALMVDLHVYVIPPDLWQDRLQSATNQIINETISAGFVRVFPEMPLVQLRIEVSKQLGFDIIPRDFVFCKSVGRGLARVKTTQENQMRVKYFLPPHAYCPEIFVLDSDIVGRAQSSSNNSQYSSVGRISRGPPGYPNGYESDSKKMLMSPTDSEDDVKRSKPHKEDTNGSNNRVNPATIRNQKSTIQKLPSLAHKSSKLTYLTEIADDNDTETNRIEENEEYDSSDTEIQEEKSPLKSDLIQKPLFRRSSPSVKRIKSPMFSATRRGGITSRRERKNRIRNGVHSETHSSPRDMSTTSEPWKLRNSAVNIPLKRRPFSDIPPLSGQSDVSTTREVVDITTLMQEIERRKKEVEWLAIEKDRRRRDMKKEVAHLETQQQIRLTEQLELEKRRRLEEDKFLSQLNHDVNSLQRKLEMKQKIFSHTEDLVLKNREKDELRYNTVVPPIKKLDNKMQIVVYNPSIITTSDNDTENQILDRKRQRKMGKSRERDRERRHNDVKTIPPVEIDSKTHKRDASHPRLSTNDCQVSYQQQRTNLMEKIDLCKREVHEVEERLTSRKDKQAFSTQSTKGMTRAMLKEKEADDKKRIMKEEAQLRTLKKELASLEEELKDVKANMQNTDKALHVSRTIKSGNNGRRLSATSIGPNNDEFLERRLEIDRVVATIQQRQKELKALELEHIRKIEEFEDEEKTMKNADIANKEEILTREKERRRHQETLLQRLRDDLRKLETDLEEKRSKIQAVFDSMRHLRDERRRNSTSSLLNGSLQAAENESEHRRNEIDQLNAKIEQRTKDLDDLERQHNLKLQEWKAQETDLQKAEEKRRLEAEMSEKQRQRADEWQMTQRRAELEHVEHELEKRRQANERYEIEMREKHQAKLKELEEAKKALNLEKGVSNELDSPITARTVAGSESSEDLDIESRTRIEQLKNEMAHMEAMRIALDKQAAEEKAKNDELLRMEERKLEEERKRLENEHNARLEGKHKRDQEEAQRRLEAEKRRLEHERQMREEKERIEQERLRIQQEKWQRFQEEQQRYERERRAMEEEEARRLAEMNMKSASQRANDLQNKNPIVPLLLIDEATPMQHSFAENDMDNKDDDDDEDVTYKSDNAEEGSHTDFNFDGLSKEALMRELQQVRQERIDMEKQREDMVRRAKQLHTKLKDKRNQARNAWKKRYFEEKKKSSPLEMQVTKLRAELETIHQKIIQALENNLKDKSMNKTPGKQPPSYMANLRIQTTRLQHEIEEMQRKVDEAKVKLTSEIKLRTQAESELKIQKAELTQKKINLSINRTQQLAAMGTQDLYGDADAPLVKSKK